MIMLPNGIFGTVLLQLPIVKYGPPPDFSPSPLPTVIPTPSPGLRDALVLPVLAVVSIGFIVFLIACAILGYVWLSRRGKDKK